MRSKSISFEFFPPKTDKGYINLCSAANKLSPIQPSFFSVTFGAGGSTRTKTYETVLNLQQTTHIQTAPHLSCIGAQKNDIRLQIEEYRKAGINQLVALRGDHPSGEVPHGEFQYASELIQFIREISGDHFDIKVACYPEFHPESDSAKNDFKHFMTKVNSGANRAITQYFYNQEAYFRFVDKVEKAQLNIPIIPGIMPILNAQRLTQFSERCGADIPRWLRWELQERADDEQALAQWGIDYLSQMCDNLLSQGAPGLHFYTLNQASASLAICRQLDLAQEHYANKNLSPEPAEVP